jgi:ADP-heptose:LPS heptosyltransferase
MSRARPLPAAETIRAKPWRHPEPPARVLAIRLQAMGDTVATFPYLRAIRRRYPGLHLDFLTRADFAALADAVVLADRVFSLPVGRTREQLLHVARLLPALRARRYDVVIDLQRNRTTRLTRLGVGAPAWSEFDRFSPLLGGERFRLTIEAAGLGPLDVLPDLELRTPEAGREKLVAAGWESAMPLVLLNPGGLDADRQWPLERYVALAEALASQDPSVRFLLLGVGKVAEKACFLRDALADRVIDLVGRTSLVEALALVRRCKLTVSEDAGLLHMSWALGVPSIGLFGASRWVWARPHGNYSRLVLACREADGTCMDGRCRRAPPSCINELDVDSVYHAAMAVLVPPEGGKVIARHGQPAWPAGASVEGSA